MKQQPSNTILIEAIDRILGQVEDGISEYQLIKCLQAEPYQLFIGQKLDDPLVLFQTHFVIYNALYTLRKTYRSQKKGELIIEATNITLAPPTKVETGLELADPLAQYYLNWNNFDETNSSDVNQLLDAFWLKMAGYSISEEQRAEALAQLELDENATPLTIKQQYRKLLHKYHPDKGGDKHRTQKIDQAYRILKQDAENIS